MPVPIRQVIPATRCQPISARLEAPRNRPIDSYKETPKLSKEQLMRKRIEAKKYYNELSRKKSSVSSETEKLVFKKSEKVENQKETKIRSPRFPPPPPPMHRERKTFRRLTTIFGRGDMPSVPEHPVQDVWKEIQELTGLLSEMRPLDGISREDVERHVANVRKLVE